MLHKSLITAAFIVISLDCEPYIDALVGDDTSAKSDTLVVEQWAPSRTLGDLALSAE